MQSQPSYQQLFGIEKPKYLDYFKGVDSEQVTFILTHVANAIGSFYKSYCLKKQFYKVRQRLYRCEQSMGTHILKRLVPQEAAVLCDPVLKSKVRFRLSGPHVLFV